MADGIDFTLEGAEELQKLFSNMSDKMVRRATSRAARKSLKPAHKKAKSNALRFDDPETAESIAKNLAIKVSTKRFKLSGIIKASLGVRGGAKDDGNGGKFGDTWYWRLLEFGTVKMPAQPFLRPAFNPRQAEQVFTAAMREEIKKEIAKHGII